MSQSTYQVRKPVKIGADFRQPGELIPEAKLWFRVDHLVHSGFITQVTVSDEDFDAAVDKYCPEQREQLTASTEEMKVQDNAAKAAYEQQILMATDPRRALTERHAAPPLTEDASRNDALAAASLRAASLDEATTKIREESDKTAGDAAKTARKKAEQLTEDEVQVEGASKQFKSENVERDEVTEEKEQDGSYDEKQASQSQRVDEARRSGDTDAENEERASSTGRKTDSEKGKQEQAKKQGQQNR